MVECGVNRYHIRNLASLSEIDPCGVRFMNSCTVRSTNPFVVGWYSEERMCLTSLFLAKASNSLLVNCGPLSVTINHLQ